MDTQETQILWDEVEVFIFWMKEREENINNQTHVNDNRMGLSDNTF